MREREGHHALREARSERENERERGVRVATRGIIKGQHFESKAKT